jgi:hypothetical protein
MTAEQNPLHSASLPVTFDLGLNFFRHRVADAVRLDSATAMKSPPGDLSNAGESRSHGMARPRWLRVCRITLGLAALLGLIIVWGTRILDSNFAEFSSVDSLPNDGRPAFVTTRAYAKQNVPGKRALQELLLSALFKLREWISQNNAAAALFVPSQIHACSVQALLNDCMQTTGKRYLIAREALVVMYFGHTNTLIGPQWVAAVEQALRDDGFLLLSDKTGVVKVLPKIKFDDYRKAGLVKDEDHPL